MIMIYPSASLASVSQRLGLHELDQCLELDRIYVEQAAKIGENCMLPPSLLHPLPPS